MMEPILAQVSPAPAGLSGGGWIMMITCLTLVCGLCVFCLWRMLREPRPGDHHHVPLDLRTDED